MLTFKKYFRECTEKLEELFLAPEINDDDKVFSQSMKKSLLKKNDVQDNDVSHSERHFNRPFTFQLIIGKQYNFHKQEIYGK